MVARRKKRRRNALCLRCFGMPLRYAITGYCLCEGHGRPDNLPISTGVHIDFTTGIASHYESLVACRRSDACSLHERSLMQSAYANGGKTNPPTKLAYIFLDRFLERFPEAAELGHFFKMYVDPLEARVFAREVYAEQTQKHALRKGARKRSLNTPEAPRVEADASSQSSQGTQARTDQKSIKRGGIIDLVSDNDSEAEIEASRESVGDTASPDVDSSDRKSDRRKRHETYPLEDTVTASTSKLRQTILQPTSPASDHGEDLDEDRRRAKGKQKENEKPEDSQVREAVNSTSSITKRRAEVVVEVNAPRSSTSGTSTSTSNATHLAGAKTSTPQKRSLQANHAIPLPRRMRQRLSQIGYDTVEQLQDAGLRMTSDDLKALAKSLSGPEVRHNTEGLDVVEEVAMRLRLDELQS